MCLSQEARYTIVVDVISYCMTLAFDGQSDSDSQWQGFEKRPRIVESIKKFLQMAVMNHGEGGGMFLANPDVCRVRNILTMFEMPTFVVAGSHHERCNMIHSNDSDSQWQGLEK